jgi:hypothetical protein
MQLCNNFRHIIMTRLLCMSARLPLPINNDAAYIALDSHSSRVGVIMLSLEFHT